METPRKIAARLERVGTLVASATVEVLEDGKHFVIVSSPWAGTGHAIGKWPRGFKTADLTAEHQRKYFCSKFSMNHRSLSAAGFEQINRLYLEALDEATKQAVE